MWVRVLVAVLTSAKKLLEKSELMKGIMQDVTSDTGPIPLNNVSMNVLKKILEWADHHKDDPVEEKEDDSRSKKSTDIDDWDQRFMQVDQEMLFEIILVCPFTCS
jgi:S-phase kinase-associated protein 1